MPSSQQERRTFYDEHPFGWAQPFDPDRPLDALTPLLAATLAEAQPSDLLLDIGCGAGRVMSYAASRGLNCVGLDRSEVSTRLMVEHSGKAGVVGDNLALPFRDGTADLVVSDGVIHHTTSQFKAFAENCRVLREGGFLYLAAYKPGGRYPALYRSAGHFIRRLVRRPAGRALIHLTLVPLYYLVHVVKSRGKRTWPGVRDMFYDYFVTPHVAFLSYGQIELWCRECGVDITKYDSNPSLNVHSFLIRKPSIPVV